jgi:hypothetical protein
VPCEQILGQLIHLFSPTGGKNQMHAAAGQPCSELTADP